MVVGWWIDVLDGCFGKDSLYLYTINSQHNFTTMFISRNLSNQLHNLFSYNPNKGFKVPDGVPGWVYGIKGTRFSKEIYYLTDPITKAKDFFVDRLNENPLISYEWAKNASDFQKTIIIGNKAYPDNIFLVEKIGLTVYIGQVFQRGSIGSGVITRAIYFEDGETQHDIFWYEMIDMDDKTSEEFIQRNFSLIPYFIFLDYAQIEEKIVKANTKQRGISKKSGDTNLSDFDIKRIDSMYFTRIIREEGFSVSGHFRLQPCGEGLRDRKLIYINPFEKNGYTRRAKIEME